MYIAIEGLKLLTKEQIIGVFESVIDDLENNTSEDDNIIDKHTTSIFEVLEPQQVLILYKDLEGIVYIGNEEGEAFITKVYWKDIKEKYNICCPYCGKKLYGVTGISKPSRIIDSQIKK